MKEHRVAIMQPYLFPYIGYWQLIQAVDLFIVYDDVNYIKQGWIARNKILSSGKEFMLILQLNGASSFKQINEIEIGNNAAKLLKTIDHAYLKAPYYHACYPIIQKIMTNNEKSLARFLTHQIELICEYLGITTKIALSSSIQKDLSLKGQDKVLEICKINNATSYINVISGQSLYSTEDFRNEGINLQFLKSKEISYKQFNNEFVSYLSIIDVLMFNPVEKIRVMLNNYELI